MNTIDDRITAALHAQVDGLTEADLLPAAPPTSRVVRPDQVRWTAPLLAAAAVGILAVGTVITVQLSRSGQHAGPATGPVVPPSPSVLVPSPASTAPTPTLTPSSPASTAATPTLTPSPSASFVPTPGLSQPVSSLSPIQPVQPTGSASQPPSTVAPPAFAFGYQPLWPFGSYAEAEQWRIQGGGSQPWHLDAGQTALNFTRSYLGFTEMTMVTGTRTDDRGAHVGIGYRDPNGQSRTAATLHLVRYGAAAGAAWEVVGSDDTTLSLEQPAYGSRVTSPMSIGGHITGVDENIVVSVLASQGDRSTVARVPAGGDHSPWTTGPVSFSQRGVLTLVASTGGHLQQVERFAIHGVHT